MTPHTLRELFSKRNISTTWRVQTPSDASMEWSRRYLSEATFVVMCVPCFGKKNRLGNLSQEVSYFITRVIKYSEAVNRGRYVPGMTFLDERQTQLLLRETGYQATLYVVVPLVCGDGVLVVSLRTAARKRARIEMRGGVVRTPSEVLFPAFRAKTSLLSPLPVPPCRQTCNHGLRRRFSEKCSRGEESAGTSTSSSICVCSTGGYRRLRTEAAKSGTGPSDSACGSSDRANVFCLCFVVWPGVPSFRDMNIYSSPMTPC